MVWCRETSRGNEQWDQHVFGIGGRRFEVVRQTGVTTSSCLSYEFFTCREDEFQRAGKKTHFEDLIEKATPSPPSMVNGPAFYAPQAIVWICGQLVALLTLLALGQDVLLQNRAAKGLSHISILTEPTRPARTDVSTGGQTLEGGRAKAGI